MPNLDAFLKPIVFLLLTILIGRSYSTSRRLKRGMRETNCVPNEQERNPFPGPDAPSTLRLTTQTKRGFSQTATTLRSSRLGKLSILALTTESHQKTKNASIPCSLVPAHRDTIGPTHTPARGVLHRFGFAAFVLSFFSLHGHGLLVLP